MDDSITPQSELVFLLHGIAANRWMMHTLAKRLTKSGYEVNNWGYASTWGSIEDHSRRLAEALQAADNDPSITTIHIVVHSMGSIVTRHALWYRAGGSRALCGPVGPTQSRLALGERVWSLAPPALSSDRSTSGAEWKLCGTNWGP